MMQGFRAAVQFITMLPAGRTAVYQPREMIAWFPVVGLLLGSLLAVFDAAACRLFAGSAPAAALDIVLLIILTGAFHLDGLADSADGLFGHRDRETVLAIMKDSRIGVMGLAAVLCGLGVKFAGIAAMPWPGSLQRFLVFLLVPGLARSSMIFAIRALPYGRPDGGTGRDLFGRAVGASDFRLMALCLVPALFLGWRGLWIVAAFFVLVYAQIAYYRRRIGCITGDMLGAMTEVTEALLFLAAALP
ncbi:MAG TPA: adenosylcobinamide-GDP ribazoletransferase [Desulfosalsimonadaceae bacterium]|nr:adenosylcobinamide-GDP ribazoletransferase [Desulfosalsimonadaceae bacterium]